jgi:hypothetical protein
VPDKTWFHLEVYYKAAATNGSIIVWQDGVEIFRLSASNLNTLNSGVLGNTSVMWGIGNYVDKQSTGGRHLLYTDEAIVSDTRVGISELKLATPPAPTNLTVKVDGLQ